MTEKFYKTVVKPAVDRIESYVKENGSDPEEFVVDALCIQIVKNEFNEKELKKVLTGATPLERRVLSKQGIDIEHLLAEINKMDT